MDPAEYGFIELGYSVCREEQNSLVILQFTKKDRDKGVPMKTL